MKWLKKLFVPEEVNTVLEILDGEKTQYNCSAFDMLYSTIKNIVISNSNTVLKQIKEGISPEQFTYSAIANLAGDLLESGKYHIYRGVLNPIGIGKDLLEIFDTSVDKMILIGVVNKDYADEQKRGIRDNIKNVG